MRSASAAIASGVALANLGVALLLAFLFRDIADLTPEATVSLARLTSISRVVGPLTLLLMALSVVVWREGYWSRKRRVLYSLNTLAAVAFFGWQHYWNISGF